MLKRIISPYRERKLKDQKATRALTYALVLFLAFLIIGKIIGLINITY